MSWGVGLFIVIVMCLIGFFVLSGIEDIEDDY